MEQQMNENINLIGFENGVYDLDTMTFRDKKKEDNITLSTGYDYIEYKNNKDEEFERKEKILEKYFTSIQPNINGKNNLKMYLASLLYGNNEEKVKCMVFSGDGRNGKTTLLNLVKKVLGDYYLKINSSLISRMHETKLSPELLNVKGKRCLEIENVIEEVNLKKISVRNLYEKEIEFKPQFKLVTECENYNLNGNNNVSVLNFPNKFMNSPNKNIDKELEDCKEVLMWLLINNYYKE